jgi:hypothetical protein
MIRRIVRLIISQTKVTVNWYGRTEDNGKSKVCRAEARRDRCMYWESPEIIGAGEAD